MLRRSVWKTTELKDFGSQMRLKGSGKRRKVVNSTARRRASMVQRRYRNLDAQPPLAIQNHHVAMPAHSPFRTQESPPCAQYFVSSDPKNQSTGMVFGTRSLKGWVPGPSGQGVWGLHLLGTLGFPKSKAPMWSTRIFTKRTPNSQKKPNSSHKDHL